MSFSFVLLLLSIFFMLLLLNTLLLLKWGDSVKKVKTSISLDEDVCKKIKEIGIKEDRSFSQQVNKILRDFIKGR